MLLDFSVTSPVPLRALASNGDFDAYWRYHIDQEHRRVHHARYRAAATNSQHDHVTPEEPHPTEFISTDGTVRAGPPPESRAIQQPPPGRPGASDPKESPSKSAC